jgi:hypothetical protein
VLGLPSHPAQPLAQPPGLPAPPPAANPQPPAAPPNAGGGAGDIVYGGKIIKTVSAEDVNSWWKIEKGYDNPPYKPNSVVTEIELIETAKFVRVYDGKKKKMQGGWIMKAEDIAGLSPQQIKDLYALPNVPQYICDVDLPAGTRLRMGIANEISGWGKGGGNQYDLMGQYIDGFSNERLLP